VRERNLYRGKLKRRRREKRNLREMIICEERNEEASSEKEK